MFRKSVFKIILFICLAFVFLFGGVLIIWYFAAPNQLDEAKIEVNKPPEQISNVAKTPVSVNKGERNPKLQSDADALLPLFDKMPSVPIFITNEAIQKGGTNIEGGVAYNVCESKNPTIYMKRAFYQTANRKQLMNILKHELTHAYFCRQGVQAGHDARFREKFTQVGGFGN